MDDDGRPGLRSTWVVQNYVVCTLKVLLFILCTCFYHHVYTKIKKSFHVFMFVVLPSPERCGNQSPSVRVRRGIGRAVRNVSPRRVITVEHIGRTVV